jgi:hypothetical protein
MTTTTPLRGNKAAALYVAELHGQLEARNLTLDIYWRWSGRRRDGVLNIFDPERHVVFSYQFERNTQRWGRTDETLHRVRTGSPRHRAVVAALEHVLAMQ